MRLFLGQNFGKIFVSSMSIWRNFKTWELFLALINLILRWSVYLSSIFKIGSCSDECEHLYPLLGIFKIRMLIKYSVNFLGIWSSREIILSSSTKLILECFVTFSNRSGLTVFQMFYYQSQPLDQDCYKILFLISKKTEKIVTLFIVGVSVSITFCI